MNKFKKILINKLIKHLFKGFTEEEIIWFDGKHFHYKDRILSDKEVKNIMDSLKLLDINDGYQYLIRDVEYLVERKLFIESKTEDDMFFSKISLFIIDTIKKRKQSLLNDYEKWKRNKNIK